MNNYFILSKLKEGQRIKGFAENSNKTLVLEDFTVIGNSPLIKKLAIKNDYHSNYTVDYSNKFFNGFYDFNKGLFKDNKELHKLILQEEMNVAISINSLERALDIKRELEEYNNKIIDKKKWKLFK